MYSQRELIFLTKRYLKGVCADALCGFDFEQASPKLMQEAVTRALHLAKTRA